MSKVGPKTALFSIQLVMWTICCHFSPFSLYCGPFAAISHMWCQKLHFSTFSLYCGPFAAISQRWWQKLWTICCHTSKVGPQIAPFSNQVVYGTCYTCYTSRLCFVDLDNINIPFFQSKVVYLLHHQSPQSCFGAVRIRDTITVDLNRLLKWFFKNFSSYV